MSDAYTDYGLFLEGFLTGKMSAVDFQRTYLDRFKNESRKLDDALFEVLDELFGDVDAFVADPSLLANLDVENPGFYLDEKALREKVSQAAEHIARLRR